MKERLDVLLVKKGLAPSREKAKAVIMAGSVYVDGQKEDKAGSVFDEESAQIEVRGHALPYVSRGGLKLEKALKVFPITIRSVWISEHLPEALPIVCYRMEPQRYILWMWATDSLTGNYVRTIGLSVWKRPISAI